MQANIKNEIYKYMLVDSNSVKVQHLSPSAKKIAAILKLINPPGFDATKYFIKLVESRR